MTARDENYNWSSYNKVQTSTWRILLLKYAWFCDCCCPVPYMSFYGQPHFHQVSSKLDTNLCHIAHSVLSTPLLPPLVLLCSPFVWVPSCNSFSYGSCWSLLLALLYGGIGPSVWLLVVLLSFFQWPFCVTMVLQSCSLWPFCVLVPVGPYGPLVLLLMVLLGGYLQSFYWIILIFDYPSALWVLWLSWFGSSDP